MRGRRRFPRHLCAGTAELQISPGDAPFPARIANLSVEGCLLILPEPRAIRMDALVELTFDFDHLPFRVRGQVKSIQSETAIGFFFAAISPRVRDQLEDLVEELAERRLKSPGPAHKP